VWTGLKSVVGCGNRVTPRYLLYRSIRIGWCYLITDFGAHLAMLKSLRLWKITLFFCFLSASLSLDARASEIFFENFPWYSSTVIQRRWHEVGMVWPGRLPIKSPQHGKITMDSAYPGSWALLTLGSKIFCRLRRLNRTVGITHIVFCDHHVPPFNNGKRRKADVPSVQSIGLKTG
jgi:hypothetical protein